MKVNPKIKEFLNEITKEAINFGNTPIGGPKRNIIRKYIRFFKENLTEEEQIYLIYCLLELNHYKNLIIDPEHLNTIYNIKFKGYTVIAIITITSVFIVFGIILNEDVFNKLKNFAEVIIRILLF